MIDRPVFVMGCGRSGTSALLEAVGEYPQILSVGMESPQIIEFAKLLATVDSDHYYRSCQRLPPAEFQARLTTLCFNSTHCSEREMGKRIINGVRKFDFSLLQKRFWAAKVEPTSEEFEQILKLFPSARFLYIVRNGLEVVESRTKAFNFKNSTFAENCRQWSDAVLLKYSYCEHAPAVLTLRQEHLLDRPESLFQEVARFLGIEHSTRPVQFIKSTLVKPFGKETAANVEVTTIVAERPSPYASWDEEQRRIFKSVCSTAMQRLGYEMPF